jgi:hypothetical protein
LSRRSNILIGGDAPSAYLKRIEDKQGLSSQKLDAILRTHLIEPQYLRNDDFEGFTSARMEALANIVAAAMGKPVVNADQANEIERDDESTAELEENERLDEAA